MAVVVAAQHGAPLDVVEPHDERLGVGPGGSAGRDLDDGDALRLAHRHHLVPPRLEPDIERIDVHQRLRAGGYRPAAGLSHRRLEADAHRGGRPPRIAGLDLELRAALLIEGGAAERTVVLGEFLLGIAEEPILPGLGLERHGPERGETLRLETGRGATEEMLGVGVEQHRPAGMHAFRRAVDGDPHLRGHEVLQHHHRLAQFLEGARQDEPRLIAAGRQKFRQHDFDLRRAGGVELHRQVLEHAAVRLEDAEQRGERWRRRQFAVAHERLVVRGLARAVDAAVAEDERLVAPGQVGAPARFARLRDLRLFQRQEREIGARARDDEKRDCSLRVWGERQLGQATGVGRAARKLGVVLRVEDHLRGGDGFGVAQRVDPDRRPAGME